MSEKTSAQLCRENGWGVGTVLEQCAKGCGPSWEASQIRIVAVTEEGVLAYRTCFIESTGRRYNCERWDRLWDLTRCTWKAVAAEPAAGGEEGASELERLRVENARLAALLNTPEIVDFAKAVPLEAAHQRERWGSAHDAGKTPADWFWLVGYLAGKALNCHLSGNFDKALHHAITVAAACCNWHAAILGATDMRPGCDPERFNLPAPQEGGAA